ncbi:hypothetical protein FACS189464_1740 [Bacteroidia bacterium]|nr:hypothetical protein FACS189464_1740 [Bacteroidia bacterium]
MFQVLDFELPIRIDSEHPSTSVIDDVLKTQYKGISGVTVWTPDYEDLRKIDIGLKLDGKEIFPEDFPAEIFSVNPFRNIEDCTLTLDMPAMSKIEGVIKNANSKAVPVKLILFVKL